MLIPADGVSSIVGVTTQTSAFVHFVVEFHSWAMVDTTSHVDKERLNRVPYERVGLGSSNMQLPSNVNAAASPQTVEDV